MGSIVKRTSVTVLFFVDAVQEITVKERKRKRSFWYSSHRVEQ